MRSSDAPFSDGFEPHFRGHDTETSVSVIVIC